MILRPLSRFFGSLLMEPAGLEFAYPPSIPSLQTRYAGGAGVGVEWGGPEGMEACPSRRGRKSEKRARNFPPPAGV